MEEESNIYGQRVEEGESGKEERERRECGKRGKIEGREIYNEVGIERKNEREKEE